MMLPQEVIRRKRNGEDLNRDVVKEFIEGLTKGTVSEGQVAAFAMAVYFKGMSRVGCFPCIYAQKEEIRVLADHAPERIAEIRSLEIQASALRAKRNAEHRAAYEAGGGTPEAYKPRYAVEHASFFMGDTPEERQSITIDDVVSWSRTERGGRQLSLLPTPPSGGCFRWGVCEPPPNEGGKR